MTNYNFLKYKTFFVSLSTILTIGCFLIILIGFETASIESKTSVPLFTVNS